MGLDIRYHVAELEVNTILKQNDMYPFRISHIDLDLPERQGDPLYIAKEKCEEAAREVGSSVLAPSSRLDASFERYSFGLGFSSHANLTKIQEQDTGRQCTLAWHIVPVPHLD